MKQAFELKFVNLWKKSRHLSLRKAEDNVRIKTIQLEYYTCALLGPCNPGIDDKLMGKNASNAAWKKLTSEVQSDISRTNEQQDDLERRLESTTPKSKRNEETP